MLDQSLPDTELAKIIGSKYDMLDEMGINQHHDAVTGTAKQAVADDYAWRLFRAMKANSEEYGQLLADKVKMEMGHESLSKNWEQCLRTNSTYRDCPIAKYATKEGYSMAAIVQNPSSLDLTSAKVAVPHAAFSAKVFDKEAGEFKEVQASVLCDKDYDLDG